MPWGFSRSGAATLLLLAYACAFPFSSEGSSLERITLLTSGTDCSSYHDVMTKALRYMDGVVHIEPSLIPEHIMVDQAAGHRTAEDLATILNRDMPVGARCHVAVMNSCITAKLAGTLRNPTQSSSHR